MGIADEEIKRLEIKTMYWATLGTVCVPIRSFEHRHFQRTQFTRRDHSSH